MCAKFRSFTIIHVYRFNNNFSIESFRETILENVDLGKTTIICGDFNLDLKVYPNNNFSKALHEIGFSQIVTEPTHIQGGLIDHVYFYSPSKSRCMLNKIHPLYYSDHDAVTFFLKLLQ